MESRDDHIRPACLVALLPRTSADRRRTARHADPGSGAQRPPLAACAYRADPAGTVRRFYSGGGTLCGCPDCLAGAGFHDAGVISGRSPAARRLRTVSPVFLPRRMLLARAMSRKFSRVSEYRTDFLGFIGSRRTSMRSLKHGSGKTQKRKSFSCVPENVRSECGRHEEIHRNPLAD